MLQENLDQFRRATHGTYKSGLMLVPASTNDVELLEGLELLFREEVKNGTISPGSPKINGRTVSVEEWINHISQRESSSIVHAIRVIMDYGEEFTTVGHTTCIVPVKNNQPVEIRRYIHKRENRGNWLGTCVLSMLVNALANYDVTSVITFVLPENTSSIRSNVNVFGQPTKGYPGKPYDMRVFQKHLTTHLE